MEDDSASNILVITAHPDDVDADTQKAVGLGAMVAVEPHDIPGTGRFSILADPQGAVFALFQG